ncbi:MAG: aldehyde dehydrogenase family protein [Bacteroidota bacterium]
MKQIYPKAEWSKLIADIKSICPEAFNENGDILNLIKGKWQNEGNLKPFNSCIDGTMLGYYPMLRTNDGKEAVEYCAKEFSKWGKTDLDTRKELVTKTLDKMNEHKELLTYVLMWEIGKPYLQALDDVERCIEGVRWYVENIESMLNNRTPLGVISNIASWNYPLSVLVHACLIQILAGNVVIAKTPSDGGLWALTVCFALAKQNGLPVSLISGSGGVLSEALVSHDSVDCLSYVGGKSNGRMIASSLFNQKKRYMLEMEGINTYGVWDFSDWDHLAKQLKSGFKYGKQRCTAYVRYVIQRDLFPSFLEMYLSVLKKISFGNPLLVKEGESELPNYDFGPLINSGKVSDLNVFFNDALGKGAVSIYQGQFKEDNFLPHQDTSSYYAPAALLNLPRNAQLYHNEPFGPLDSIILVDSKDELITEMNVSNGALVSSIACDKDKDSEEIAIQLRGYKVGVNAMKSRGDREATFGGLGESWKGCFVGGEYLVQAVTNGPSGERLFGNFPEYTLLPTVK